TGLAAGTRAAPSPAVCSARPPASRRARPPARAARRRGAGPRTALAGDLRLFARAVPHPRPLRHRAPARTRLRSHLAGEGLAPLVVVAQLQTVLPVDRVLGRAGAAEDVHGADVPAVERLLRLVVGLGVFGQPLHPELPVADMELLLLEDALDGADP